MAPKDDEKKVNWFRAMDKDGNGEITMAEQIMTWEGLGAHEMANIDMIHPLTMKWDTDKDGKLNMDEYKQQPWLNKIGQIWSKKEWRKQNISSSETFDVPIPIGLLAPAP